MRHNLLNMSVAGLAILLAGVAVSAQDDRSRERDRDTPIRSDRDVRTRDGDPQRSREDRDDRSRDERSSQEMREGGIPRAQLARPDRDDSEGTEEGMPSMRADTERLRTETTDPRRTSPQFMIRDRHQWKLGVYAYNTDTGVVITRVLPRTAAWEAGLESGDRIVTINGFQVGWVDDRLYPLGAELNRQAGRRGRVMLLIQNVRNDRLLTRNVWLDDAGYSR